MFFAYILIDNTKSKFYKGHTQDLSLRLQQHNAGKTKSTKGAQWSVFYFETFDSRESAIKRERYFKSAAGRRFIHKLVFILERDGSPPVPNGTFGRGFP